MAKVRFQLIPTLRDRLSGVEFSDAERDAFLKELLARVVATVRRVNGANFSARSHPRLVLHLKGSDPLFVAFDHIEYATRVALVNVVGRELMREHESGRVWSGGARPRDEPHAASGGGARHLDGDAERG